MPMPATGKAVSTLSRRQANRLLEWIADTVYPLRATRTCSSSATSSRTPRRRQSRRSPVPATSTPRRARTGYDDSTGGCSAAWVLRSRARASRATSSAQLPGTSTPTSRVCSTTATRSSDTGESAAEEKPDGSALVPPGSCTNRRPRIAARHTIPSWSASSRRQSSRRPSRMTPTRSTPVPCSRTPSPSPTPARTPQPSRR